MFQGPFVCFFIKITSNKKKDLKIHPLGNSCHVFTTRFTSHAFGAFTVIPLTWYIPKFRAVVRNAFRVGEENEFNLYTLCMFCYAFVCVLCIYKQEN